MQNCNFFEDLSVFDIVVISGVRLKGRMVDHSLNGRKNSGILYIWKGEAAFYKPNGEKITVSDGEVTFLPKNNMYRMEFTAENTTIVVVNFNLYDKNNGETVLFDDITVMAKDDRTNIIAKTMMNFELCGVSKTIGATLRKKELMYRLIGLIHSSNPHLYADTDMNPKIADGVRLLEQTYLENLPVDRFAEECHMSISMFRKLFHDCFNISPVKYRNNLRIKRAKELLQDGSLNIAEVAYNCGFENIGYFYRYYRYVTGESPGTMKQRNKVNEQDYCFDR